MIFEKQRGAKQISNKKSQSQKKTKEEKRREQKKENGKGSWPCETAPLLPRWLIRPPLFPFALQLPTSHQ